MQFGVREVFLLASGVLLLILIIVSLRKAYSRKYTTIRSNADPSKEKYADLPIVDPASSELAGGARVVGYRDLEDIETLNKRLRDQVEQNRPRLKSLEALQQTKGQVKTPPAPTSVAETSSEELNLDHLHLDEEVPVLLDVVEEQVGTIHPPSEREHRQPSLFGDESNSPPTETRSKPISKRREEPRIHKLEPDVSGHQKLSAATPPPAHKPAISGGSEHANEPTPEKTHTLPSEVLILNVMTTEAMPYQGLDMQDILLDVGMHLSDRNFFEMDDRETGEMLFSLANIFNPGTFDQERMRYFSTIGLCFFQPLNEDADNHKVFETMLRVASRIVKELGGQLCNENREALTTQSVEHYRNRIAEFERMVSDLRS